MKLGGRSDRLGCGWLGGFEAGGTEGVPFEAGDCVILELMVLGVGVAVLCALPVGVDEDPPWSWSSRSVVRIPEGLLIKG
jgi:hypothetical protein